MKVPKYFIIFIIVTLVCMFIISFAMTFIGHFILNREDVSTAGTISIVILEIAGSVFTLLVKPEDN